MAKTAFNANEMSSFDIERIKRQRSSITSTKNTSTQRTISTSKNIDIDEKRRRILFANEKDFVFENTGFLTEYSSAMKQRILDSDYVCLSFRATADAPSSRPLAIGNASEIGPGCDWRRYKQLAQVAGFTASVNSATRLRIWVVGTAYGVTAWDLDALDQSAAHELISDSINSKRLYCYNAAELFTWAMRTAGTVDLTPAQVYDPLWHVRYVDPGRTYDISKVAVTSHAAAALVEAHKKTSPPASLAAIMMGSGLDMHAGAGNGKTWSVAPLSAWHYRNAVAGNADPHRVMIGRWNSCTTQVPAQLARISCNGIPVDIKKLNATRCDAAAVVADAADAVVAHIPALAVLKSRLSAMSGGATDEIRCAIGAYAETSGIELDVSDTGIPSISMKSVSNSGAIAMPGITAWCDLCDAKRTLAACDDLIASVTQDGRVHPVFGYDTATGRLTAKRPAAMAMDARLRTSVTAPDGFVIISADYSQIELRIAACVAEKMRAGVGQPGMLATAFRKGVDPHLVTALQSVRQRGDIDFEGNAAAYIAGLCNTKLSELQSLLSTERDTAKAPNFGLLYGMKDASFWEYGRTAFGLNWTMEQAAQARLDWFTMYPEIGQLHESYRHRFNVAQKETLFSKTYAGGFEVSSARIMTGQTLGGRAVAAAAPLQLLNYECQGTGADIIIGAITEMDQRVSRHIVNVVHDELVLCVPEPDSVGASDEIRRAMLSAEDEVFSQYGIPSSVDLKISKSWL